MNRTLKILSLAVVATAAVALAVGPAGGQGQGMFCNMTPVAIPAGAVPANSDIVVGPSFLLTDLDISIQTNHTWVGDLIYTLSKTAGPGAPLGPITIVNRPGQPASGAGCSINDINATLSDGSVPVVETVCNAVPPAIGPGPYGPDPDSINGTFAGVDVNGTWRLTITDNAAGDTGTLIQWCLVTTPVPVELMEFTIE